MQKLFLDINIVIDFLGDRFPFSESASNLIYLAEDKKVELYVSPASYTVMYYILKKTMSHNQLINSFKQLNKSVRIMDIGENTIAASLDSGFPDFEDAVQYYSAKEVKGIGAIITRDKKDFSKSKIPVMTAEEYLKTIRVD